MSPSFRTSLALASLVPFQLGAQALASQDSANSQRPVVRASRSEPIRIDGVLSDHAWASTDSIVELRQTEPNEGATASGRTVVRVLTTPDALVLGIRVDQPSGVPLVSFARERDA